MSEKRITQVEIAEKSGIDKSTISRYLSGVKIPFLSTATHIAKVCDLPIEIFTSRAVQQKVFGKVFLKNDVSYKKKRGGIV